VSVEASIGPLRSVNTTARGQPAVRMIWDDLLFLHWPVPADVVRPLVPPPLEIDLFEGLAWVGLVPFTMPAVRPAWMPRFLRLGINAFHECNVRTYVRSGAGSGVWFFSLDASSRMAAWWARRFWHLPYFHAAIQVDPRSDVIHYSVERLTRNTPPPAPRLTCAWRVGRPRASSRPGDLAHFLTERYQLFCVNRGTLQRGRIWHEPWPLHEADLLDLDDTLVSAAGIAGVSGEPVVYAARRLHVNAWSLDPVVQF
jgi:hypothetical protein